MRYWRLIDSKKEALYVQHVTFVVVLTSNGFCFSRLVIAFSGTKDHFFFCRVSFTPVCEVGDPGLNPVGGLNFSAFSILLAVDIGTHSNLVRTF